MRHYSIIIDYKIIDHTGQYVNRFIGVFSKKLKKTFKKVKFAQITQ